jgi:hypothetical protein
MNIVALTSTMHYIVGIGLPLGSLPFALYVLVNRRLPEAFGVRFYGGGFIERQAGTQGVMATMFPAILVTSIYVLAGYWLGKSMKLGAILSLTLLPINMFFALGYEAPVPIVLHPVMAVLVLLTWSSLH